MRTLAVVLVLPLASCGTSAPQPREPGQATEAASLKIGPAGTDTLGGWLPDGQTLTAFDVFHPVIQWLDPPLLKAIQDATQTAAAEGVDIEITSGWRSKGFQQRLFDTGVVDYGSVEAARQFVAAPDVSKHVDGKAVDVAPIEADRWLIAHGAEFGLCQIYANEIWHFELAVDDQGRCPPLKPNAAAG